MQVQRSICMFKPFKNNDLKLFIVGYLFDIDGAHGRTDAA
jgi:hypothetical protein